MVTFKIYIEGGGDSSAEGGQFRQAWQAFFAKAGLQGRMPAVVRGGGRQQTFDRFCHAVANPRGREVPLLLIDSEDTVAASATAWQHLRERDGFVRPDSAADDQAFLMVQVMETWFLADRAALGGFFGADFRGSAVPTWTALESVAKANVLGALDSATVGCKRRYAKGRRSFELLCEVEPAVVAQACPHAAALLVRLRGWAVA